MANQTITQLPDAGPITGTELVPIVQNGGTFKTTTAAIASSPSQSQTFLTKNQEPTLPNSRYLSTGTGLGLVDGGAQSYYRITLNGVSGSLEAASNGIIVKYNGSILSRALATSGAGLSVSDADGTAGNPTFQLTGIAAAVANLGGTGMMAIVGGSTVAGRQILGAANQISVVNGNGADDPQIFIANNPIIPGVEGMTIPSGTEAQKPAGSSGQIRFNTESQIFEGYANGSWKPFSLDAGVASVGLAMPGDFIVTNSPVTSVGTLTAAWASQSANLVLASPDGSSGTPSFRALTNTDIPTALSGKTIDNSVIGGTTPAAGTFTSAEADYFQLDTTAGAASAVGRIVWDDGDGSPTVLLKGGQVNLPIGQENVVLVYNGTASTLNVGQVVAVSGAQGQRPRVVLADADSEPLSAATIGVVSESIPSGSEGFVSTFGIIRGIDTSAFVAGDDVYLSTTAGQFTATRPSAPAHTVFLGWVIKVNASSGELFLNINNGWELDELHNVKITSVQNNDLLQYTTSGPYWQNVAPSSVSVGTATNVAGGAANRIVYNTAAGTTSFITAPTVANTYLEWSGAAFQWSSNPLGDVSGPASSTDNAIARFDGTTGKLIQNSAVTIADDGTTVISTNSTGNALRITQTGTGNALVVEDSANPDSTPFVVDASGRTYVGNTTSYAVGATDTPLFQISAANSSTAQASVGAYNAATSAGKFTFVKSRSGTNGTLGGIVSSGDVIGTIAWRADDGVGANPIQAAALFAEVDGTPGTNDMPGRLVFSTTADGASSPTERMRIDSAGNVGIGAAAGVGQSFRLFKNITGATTSYGYISEGVVQSDVTAAAYLFQSTSNTAAASFTLGELRHYQASQGTFGAGSTVSNQYAFFAGATLTGATNNYGFYSNIASGTGRWNFYANGTAANVFAGTTHIGGVVGSESLRVTPIASAVNYFSLYGAATGNSLGFYAEGSDTNIGVNYVSKGTGAHFFYSATSAPQFRISHTASAVNYLQVTGAATGNGPLISTQGSDTNISTTITSKGNGIISLTTSDIASGLFGLEIGANNTGDRLTWIDLHSSVGTDYDFRLIRLAGVNAAVNYTNAGTGPHQFVTNAASEQFRIAHTASAVNYLQATGGATGNATTLSAQGSDTNINLALAAKGTGSVTTANAFVATGGISGGTF